MNKVLELIIEDFQNQKPSAKYKLVQHKVCEVETIFMKSLSKEQKKEYLNFCFVQGELDVVELDEFAEFLFERLKDITRS